MTEKEFYKKNNERLKTYMKDRQNEHIQPSTETLKMFGEQGKQLSALSEAQKFMREEISEIKSLVKNIDGKLDGVITGKADKKEVDLLWKKFDVARAWILRILIGVVLAGLGFLSKELYTHLIK